MSLLNKIFLFILITTALFITIILNIIINNERTLRLETLDSKRIYNEKVYKKMLSSLLFDLNKENITIALNALYHDDDIAKINLIDYSKTINLKLEDKNFNKKNLIESKIFLQFNKNLIGELQIFYTTKNIEDFLNNFKNKIIITSFSLMLLLLLVLFYYISYVTKSLEKLARATKNITKGNLNFNMEIHKSNDEIGELINNFEIMVNSIKDSKLNLEKQLKFQHLLLESINMPVYIKDMKGRYVDCNKSFTDFFGKSKKEIIGKDMSFLINGEFLANQQKSEKELIKSGGSITFETVFYNAKGEKRDLIQFKTIYKESGKNKWIIATYFDITERNAARKKIGIFSQAIKQSPISIIITDINANIEYTNDFYEKSSGFNLSELKGKKPRFLESNIISQKKYDEI